MSGPRVSVVIPVYNEQEVLPALFARLYPALDALGRTYELVLVDDGSRDASPRLLREQVEARPDVTRVLLLAGNFGQHMAILAGFEHARGEVLVTLDADLQNPPEEIARLLDKVDEGHDYVGSYRRTREDSAFRRLASRTMNAVRERITDIHMTDQGCMLRAYGPGVVRAINACVEASTFIPALGYTFARNPAEVEVAHEERAAGRSKYSLYRLLRLNFDLVTGFSLVPLQMFSVLGILVSAGSVIFYLALMAKRALSGEMGGLAGLWDRDILSFLLIGLVLFGLGLVGEYVGRIYAQVRGRPRYLVGAILEKRD